MTFRLVFKTPCNLLPVTTDTWRLERAAVSKGVCVRARIDYIFNKQTVKYKINSQRKKGSLSYNKNNNKYIQEQ